MSLKDSLNSTVKQSELYRLPLLGKYTKGHAVNIIFALGVNKSTIPPQLLASKIRLYNFSYSIMYHLNRQVLMGQENEIERHL